MDWLIAWGVNSAIGFLFQPVMQKFAEDLRNEVLKDIFKDVVKNLPDKILKQLEKDEIDKAVGKALKVFLEIFQDVLLENLEEIEVKKYNQSLKKFLGIDDVKTILGNPFNPNIDNIDTENLKKIWDNKNLLKLPKNFEWKKLNRAYVRKVKAIIHESNVLREIYDSYKIEEIAINTKEDDLITEFDLRRYQEAIRKKYGYLKLDSLDTTGVAYNELKLRSVFIAQNVREFQRVVPQALERRKEYHKWLRENNQNEKEFNIEELEKYRQIYQKAPIVPVTDIINNRENQNYSIVLGDPGAGKSTLLQFLALNWAESTLNNSLTQPIPILIELRTYVRQFDENRCNSFLEFIHQGSGAICHLNQLKLDEQLKQGNALMMFDGLDEIFDGAKREDIITDIIRFTDEYPKVQVIVTSRIIGYKPDIFRNAQFRHFMLQDFDDEQIQDFINRWHQLTFNDNIEAQSKKARLNSALKSSKAIQELAENPLLLTLMAILNRHRELPRDRKNLYTRAAEVLLQDWDAERYLTNTNIARFSIDLTDKQAMLRQIAYKMLDNQQGLVVNLINRHDLQKIFQEYLINIGHSKINARTAARELTNQLRERNFILCHAGDNYYAFVHRTFLEYFCAEAFRGQFEKEQKLTLEQLKNDVYGKHWQDEAWHEVLTLIAGAINVKFVSEIIEYLIQIDGKSDKFRNLFLAAGCLSEVRERKNPTISSLDKKLLESIKNLVNNTNLEEISTLAIVTIANTWNNDSDIQPWLKVIAENNEYSIIRSVAIQELARNFKDNKKTSKLLKNLAISDKSDDVRSVAIQELSRNFKNDENTLSWLKQRGKIDKSDAVRSVAVQELSRNFKDDENTLPWLKQRAEIDKSDAVRSVAVQELSRNFKDDKNTLP